MRLSDNIEGWLDADEAAELLKLVINTDGDVVEFGSYQGKSSVVLAIWGKKVYCVDSWEDYEGVSGEVVHEKFLQNTASIKNIIPVKSRVEDWMPLPAGLVFCDGDHSYEGTKVQIEKALQCNPTYIACHDVSNEKYADGVRRATDELLKGREFYKVNRLGVWKIL